MKQTKEKKWLNEKKKNCLEIVVFVYFQQIKKTTCIHIQIHGQYMGFINKHAENTFPVHVIFQFKNP